MLDRLASRICRVPPVNEPLSADAFIIEGDACFYVFDVGASDTAFEAVSALDKPVTVILSHFHRDHIANMARLTPAQVLAGVRTMKYITGGTLVDAPMIIRDGVEIVVRPCVSPHAPGCLIATVDGEYTLIGDLHYARPGLGQGEAKGMLNVLKMLDTRWFLPSHVDESPLVQKEALLREIRAWYGV